MATARSRAVDLSTTPATPVRARGRASVALVQSKATPAMITLAETAFKQNNASNAAKREGDKAKKELNILMASASLEQFDLQIDGQACEAVIEAAIGNAVDVKKLRSLVPEEVFFRIISATQSMVEAEVGKNVLMKCLVETTGEPSLKVRKKK